MLSRVRAYSLVLGEVSMLLKRKRCPNCRLATAKITLEQRGVYITCSACNYKELLWMIGEPLGKLHELLKREHVSKLKLPLCLRKSSPTW